jgi:formylglycine-generating enzyme required for sulfatase activity
MDKGKSSIIAAAIGAIALIIVAIITFWKDWTLSQLRISATQAAEARPTQFALITSMPSSTTISFRTPTTTPQLATPTLGVGSSKISPIGGMTMMFVPAGDFTMGSSDVDKVSQSDEKPQHTVYLDAFWIDRFEVTNALYKKCVDAGKC